MLGSVFSPYYAWARQRGPANPEHFCALNAVLYGARGKRWAMTERGPRQVQRQASELSIGPSQVRWEGDDLVIDIHETAVPIPQPLRGQVRVHPQTPTRHIEQLDRQGRHHWWPIAPDSRVSVNLRHPRLRWSGDGYLDSNWGSEPLEQGFIDWDWSRAKRRHGGATVLYEANRRDGSPLSLALQVNRDGQVQPFDPPARAPLSTTRVWRIPRATRSEHPDTGESRARVIETLEDTPFYARSTVATRLLGESVTAVHESLSLDRFAQRWVQLLLPFRMPRVS
ncbi:carotenoid 1,2-hydratase [Rhabdochromatium marinum]|uniref:carotenoid 1,2-hydratase n=1 Tax=Rhabdochromatium marinum TaxID=48729 RepID=UPI001F5BF758|nr:carotenoid 1,2-hydratase [Rhabdochromatium marinum]